MRTDPRETISDAGLSQEEAAVTSGMETDAAGETVAREGGRMPAWLSGLAAAPLPLVALVFVGGIVSLGLEVSGPRLMAPYFGTTELIWAAQIGFTLIYLAIGYYVGGRVADRHPDVRLLCTLTTIAAIATALIPFISEPILGWSISAFGQYYTGDANGAIALFAGSLVGVLLLFSVPTILLGMVSPFAVRLSVRQVGTTGSSAGSLYALSTIGSILGAFLPVLVLTPAWGVRRTILALALVLLLASLWGLSLGRRRSGRLRFGNLPALILLAALAILIPLAQPLVQPGQSDMLGPLRAVPNLIYEHESMYNYIQVVRAEGGVNELVLNEGASLGVIHSVYDPQHIMIGCPGYLGGLCWYSDYVVMAPYFNNGFDPSQVHSLAIVGLAGGTIARQYAAIYHPTRIDGAELDPDIVAVARKYFALDEPGLHVYYGDGRTFIRATTQSYDVLVVDAYQQPYMPFQLTTVEFYREVLSHLSPQGVVAVNSGHCSRDYQLVDALVNTLYKAGFASVYTFDVPGTINTEIVATKSSTNIDTFRQNLARVGPQSLVAAAADQAAAAVTVAPAQPNGLYFTDDRAPVEQITDSLVLNCATAA